VRRCFDERKCCEIGSEDSKSPKLGSAGSD
jgi:hypothetical protein